MVHEDRHIDIVLRCESSSDEGGVKIRPDANIEEYHPQLEMRNTLLICEYKRPGAMQSFRLVANACENN